MKIPPHYGIRIKRAEKEYDPLTWVLDLKSCVVQSCARHGEVLNPEALDLCLAEVERRYLRRPAPTQFFGKAGELRRKHINRTSFTWYWVAVGDTERGYSCPCGYSDYLCSEECCGPDGEGNFPVVCPDCGRVAIQELGEPFG